MIIISNINSLQAVENKGIHPILIWLLIGGIWNDSGNWLDNYSWID